MPIAKEVLRIGFTVAAVPGNYVTKEAVSAFGWDKQVEAGPDISADNGDTRDALAPKGKPQKGS
jgi:hypothetical protein